MLSYNSAFFVACQSQTQGGVSIFNRESYSPVSWLTVGRKLFCHLVSGLSIQALPEVRVKPTTLQWGVRSTNSKLVLQKVKGQIVQGQTAEEF